jgi:hypothetical protein
LKSRDTLTILNFKILKAILCGIENFKKQVKALRDTSNLIRLEIWALQISNEDSAYYILASNKVMLSVLVRFLPPSDSYASTNA